MDILLNWLWQGWALTAIAWTALTFSRRLSATTRYQVWWTTLILILVLPGLPLLAALVPPADGASTGNDFPYAIVLPPMPQRPLQIFFVGWAISVGVMLWRGISAFNRMCGLKQACVPFPQQCEARLPHWMSIRASGRRVRLMQSDQVRCAAAIGICSPVIVVAPVVLRELDDAELDRILVHEWAHIQRRDDIARVFQFLVNAVAGFNPAVWWISRRLDLEREVACDDLVIETTGSRRAYAKSLMKLAGIPERPRDLTLVSAALSAPALTSRILRLLDDRRNVSTGRSTMTLAVAASGLLSLALVLAGTQPVTLMATTTQIVSSSEEIFLPISSTTVNEGVIPVDRAGGAPRVSADSNTPQQGQQLIRGQKEPVASISNEPIAEALETVPLTGRPIGFDATAPVSLTEHSLALSSSTKGTTETPVAPWTSAANAGKALGRSSQERAAGAATFFTKLGKNIGGAF